MGNNDKKEIVDAKVLAKTFDDATIVLQEMQSDIAQYFMVRYGTESKVVKKKILELESLKRLHSQALGYINYMRELNHKMSINYRVMEIMAAQHETGLPWEKVARLLGWETDKFKKLDDIEPLFRKIMQDICDQEKVKIKDDGEKEN